MSRSVGGAVAARGSATVGVVAVVSVGHSFEAKGTATRNSIRLAIGQLADYGRFPPSPSRRAVLLSERPRPDLETLLESQRIAAVWRTENDGFTDNVRGQLVD